MVISLMGLGWYRREDYGQLKTMFQDGAKLPDTYDKWLESAQNLLDVLTTQGHKVVKAPIELTTFPEWCRARGLEMNAQARMEFSNEYAFKSYQH